MRLVIAMSIAAILGPGEARAQPRATPSPQWELRADASASPRLGAHGGLGVNVRAGQYARVGLALLSGAMQEPAPGRDLHASHRADATVRFLLDPYGEERRGWYGGAGFTARRDGDEAWKGDLMLVVGVEGALRGRWVPAVEVALGGGARVGLAWRTRRGGPFPGR